MDFFEFFRGRERTTEELEEKLASLQSREEALGRKVEVLDPVIKAYEEMPRRAPHKGLVLGLPGEEEKYRGIKGEFLRDLLRAMNEEEAQEVIGKYVGKMTYGGMGYTREAAKRKLENWFHDFEERGLV